MKDVVTPPVQDVTPPPKDVVPSPKDTTQPAKKSTAKKATAKKPTAKKPTAKKPKTDPDTPNPNMPHDARTAAEAELDPVQVNRYRKKKNRGYKTFAEWWAAKGKSWYSNK